MEFGIGRCLCPKKLCARKFYAYCVASEIIKCRKCKSECKPQIHPKWRKRARSPHFATDDDEDMQYDVLWVFPAGLDLSMFFHQESWHIGHPNWRSWQGPVVCFISCFSRTPTVSAAMPGRLSWRRFWSIFFESFFGDPLELDEFGRQVVWRLLGVFLERFDLQ